MRLHHVSGRFKRLASVLAILAVVGWSCRAKLDSSAPSAPQAFPPVASSLPPDFPNGASNATLQQAATFAWQEFIALNWPAVNQTGGPNQRDMPDTTKFFGDQSVPLVWQTYRAKVEIFPGNFNTTLKMTGPPHGYQSNPPNPPDYGYDEPPEYDYNRAVLACPNVTPPSQPAWINLDEVSQIALDKMFAGVVPASPQPTNSQPNLIRFMAKANRIHYRYVAQNQYWYNNPTAPLATAQKNFTNAINAVPPKVPTASVDFPPDTIEVKAAWRPLAPNEDPTRFHMTTVRYYERNDGPTCYREDRWALIALHIIRKTPTAPAFVYATFEQADNILLPALDGSGKPVPVEDVDGNIINAPAASAPTTPGLSYKDDSTNPLVSLNPPGSAYCTSPGAQIYYRNTATQTGLPTGGNICVNKRDNPIPSDIIAINKLAHDAIQSYNASNGITKSPWLYYKLVNVQPYPFDKSQIDPTNPNGMHNPATFFQANIVVETNYTLQLFHGRIQSNGAPTDYPASPPTPPPPNVFVFSGTPPTTVTSYNMGGCMGCHGNAQVAGTDFSFILNEGAVSSPEPATASATELSATYLEQFQPRR